MAINSYSSLQIAVGNWMSRSDQTSYVPDWITLAEEQINRDLDLPPQYKQKVLTATTGSPYLPLPADFGRAITLRVISGSYYPPLEYRAPEVMLTEDGAVTSAQPTRFTIIGQSIKTNFLPDSAYTFELVYTANFAALSTMSDTVVLNGTTTSGSKTITGLSSTANLTSGMLATGTGIGTAPNPILSVDSSTQVTLSEPSTASATVSITFTVTNWLILNYPSIYLFGTLYQGGIFNKDKEEITLYGALYQKAIMDARNTGYEHKYSGSALQVKPV